MQHRQPQTFLFIQDHLFGGGAERITLDIAEKLAESGHQVTLALLDATDIRMKIPPSIRFVDLAVETSLMQGRLWRKRPPVSAQTQQKVAALLAEVKPDTIIVGHWFGYLLSEYLTGNVWFWVHCEIFEGRQQQATLSRWFKELRRFLVERQSFRQRFAHRNLITVNQDLTETYKTLSPSTNIITIPNGVNLQRLNQNLPSTPSDRIWSVIYVGRLSAEKQPEHALMAFEKSQIKGRMAIVGDGDQLSSLQTLAHQLAIHDRVDFLGWQDCPQHFIQQSHMLILSSKTEGFGLVIAEALLLNVPVVAYGCSSGVRQQLNSPELQRGIAEPQNIDDLAQKLADVYRQPYSITPADQEALTLEPMAKAFESLK